jgi:hypothetical protein
MVAAAPLALIGFVALQGCESGDLMRFAPPGIVKYEDLAGDQPQNPDVAARIAERRAEPDTGEFPILSTAPGKEDRPKKRKKADVESEMSGLAGAREDLAEAVGADRAASAEELGRDLPGERDALKALIEKDEAAAARERREKLQAPDGDN